MEVSKCKLCGRNPLIAIQCMDESISFVSCDTPACSMYRIKLKQGEWEKLMKPAELPRLWIKVKEDLKHGYNVYLVSEDSEGWIGFFSTYDQAKDHAEFFSKMLGDIPIEYYEEVIVTRQKK